MTTNEVQQVTDSFISTAIDTKLLEYADKLETLAVDTAPEAFAAALAVVQVYAASNLIWGLVYVVIAFVCFKLSVIAYEYCKEKKENYPHTDWFLGMFFSFVVGCTAEIGFSIAAMNKLLDLWTWIAIVEPKLYLAKMALEKIL